MKRIPLIGSLLLVPVLALFVVLPGCGDKSGDKGAKKGDDKAKVDEPKIDRNLLAVGQLGLNHMLCISHPHHP